MYGIFTYICHKNAVFTFYHITIKKTPFGGIRLELFQLFPSTEKAIPRKRRLNDSLFSTALIHRIPPKEIPHEKPGVTFFSPTCPSLFLHPLIQRFRKVEF